MKTYSYDSSALLNTLLCLSNFEIDQTKLNEILSFLKNNTSTDILEKALDGRLQTFIDNHKKEINTFLDNKRTSINSKYDLSNLEIYNKFSNLSREKANEYIKKLLLLEEKGICRIGFNIGICDSFLTEIYENNNKITDTRISYSDGEIKKLKAEKEGVWRTKSYLVNYQNPTYVLQIENHYDRNESYRYLNINSLDDLDVTKLPSEEEMCSLRLPKQMLEKTTLKDRIELEELISKSEGFQKKLK